MYNFFHGGDIMGSGTGNRKCSNVTGIKKSFLGIIGGIITSAWSGLVDFFGGMLENPLGTNMDLVDRILFASQFMGMVGVAVPSSGKSGLQTLQDLLKPGSGLLPKDIEQLLKYWQVNSKEELVQAVDTVLNKLTTSGGKEWSVNMISRILEKDTDLARRLGVLLGKQGFSNSGDDLARLAKDVEKLEADKLAKDLAKYEKDWWMGKVVNAQRTEEWVAEKYRLITQLKEESVAVGTVYSLLTALVARGIKVIATKSIDVQLSEKYGIGIDAVTGAKPYDSEGNIKPLQTTSGRVNTSNEGTFIWEAKGISELDYIESKYGKMPESQSFWERITTTSIFDFVSTLQDMRRESRDSSPQVRWLWHITDEENAGTLDYQLPGLKSQRKRYSKYLNEYNWKNKPSQSDIEFWMNQYNEVDAIVKEYEDLLGKKESIIHQTCTTGHGF